MSTAISGVSGQDADRPPGPLEQRAGVQLYVPAVAGPLLPCPERDSNPHVLADNGF